MIINYQNLFRPTYEARSAFAWGVSLASMTGIALASDVHTNAFVWMGAGSAAMMLWRAKQTQSIWNFKANLAGKPFTFLKADVVRVNLPKFGDNLWLGWGYRWEPSHTQQATEIMKRDLAAVYPPKWFLKARPEGTAARPQKRERPPVDPRARGRGGHADAPISDAGPHRGAGDDGGDQDNAV